MDDLEELKNIAKIYIKTGSYSDTSEIFGVSEIAIVKRINKIIKKKLLPQATINKLVKTKNGNFDDQPSSSPKSSSSKSLQKKIDKLEEKLDGQDATIDQQANEIKDLNSDPNAVLGRDREVIKLKDEVKSLKGQLKVSEKDVKQLIDHNEILSKIDGRKLKTNNKIVARTKKSEATAFMIASDWHVEEPVCIEAMAGFNEFNLEIAEQRARNFFKNGLYLVKKEMQNAKIENVVLGLLGDFISNYIHPELEEEALLSPILALEFVEDLLIEGIRFLLKDGSFKKLIIPCCFGNHGRTTDKMRFSTGWSNSYETLMYRHIQKVFADDPRVEVKLTQGYHNILDVYGYLIRFHHGDAMRGGNGIGGITIPVNRSILKWNIKEMATLDVFGHFHQLQFQSRFVCNGSLIGYNQYAQRFGCEPEAPRQAFFLIDKDHGRTVCAPIFVND